MAFPISVFAKGNSHQPPALFINAPKYHYLNPIIEGMMISENNRILDLRKTDNVTNTITLSEREMECFVILIYVEAGIEDEEGQLATAATILNRLKSPEYPDSIEEIAFQGGQFSSTKNGKFYNNEKEITIDMVPDEITRIAERALEGEDPTEEALKAKAKKLGLDVEKYASDGAIYFYNPKACNEDALKERKNIKVYVKIGRHIYHKYWDV